MWQQVSSSYYYNHYYLFIDSFSHQCKLMVFHWSLSDSKSLQVSRTLLSILVVLHNAVVSMVSIRPLTSKPSSPFNNPLVTVPKAPITIGIIVTWTFHIFFNSLAKSRYLSFFSHSFSFILWSAGTAKSIILQILLLLLLLLLIIIKSGLLAEIKWSICMSESHKSLCVSFSRTAARLGIYHLFIWSNFNFLNIFQWITLSTQSCLVLYSFCANLLHSLIMWLMISSLSPHSLHLLFCCVLSIFALIWGCPRGVMVKAMDCGIVASEFVFQSRYYVYFRANTLGKGIKPSYPPNYGLNSTTTVLLGQWLWH